MPLKIVYHRDRDVFTPSKSGPVNLSAEYRRMAGEEPRDLWFPREPITFSELTDRIFLAGILVLIAALLTIYSL